MNAKLTLGENFRVRMEPKVGNYTLGLRRIGASLGEHNGALLAVALEQPCHQMAGLLEAMANLGLARSYEAGNPARGRASAVAREALGLTHHSAEVIKKI